MPKQELLQLGREQALFVGAPSRSNALSGGDEPIASVVAAGNCSATCRADGSIIRTAGKCTRIYQELLKAAARLDYQVSLAETKNTS